LQAGGKIRQTEMGDRVKTDRRDAGNQLHSDDPAEEHDVDNYEGT
jgi:hypothetical protein